MRTPLEPESAAASTWATALEVLKTLRYLGLCGLGRALRAIGRFGDGRT